MTKISATSFQVSFQFCRPYLPSPDDDDWDACAKHVQEECVKHYVMFIKQDHRFCNDASKWISCYKETAQKYDCKAKIIEHFTKMLEVVGNRIIREMRLRIGSECVKWSKEL